jgi:hypothetical protein
MGLMTDAKIDRLACTHRPPGRAIGRQSWRDLLFVHWRLPAAEIQPLIPGRLTLDVYDGSAWIGLVPFTMQGVRPWWSPPIYGVSSFHETNVRTYVHCEGKQPGVWFFSLDAASSLAVRIARWRWALPYFRSNMQLRRANNHIHYSSRRLWPAPAGAETHIEAEIGDLISNADPQHPAGRATPGTLEHFLAERYLLYSQASAQDPLYRGQVYHRPYPLRQARLQRLQESLLNAAGITPPGEPDHALFSDGVDVEVFNLEVV